MGELVEGETFVEKSREFERKSGVGFMRWQTATEEKRTNASVFWPLNRGKSSESRTNVSPRRGSVGARNGQNDDACSISTVVIVLPYRDCSCCTHACQIHIWGRTPTIKFYSSSYPYCFCTQALAGIIKSDKRPGEHYLVVDVRDSDFIGGNITNCRNAPSDTFLDNLDDLIREIKNVPQVIFHCALSQARWVIKTRVSLTP
jgi:hypothetical protein